MLNKINELIAKKATLIFGTAWMFYAFFIYGLLPLIPFFKFYQDQIFYWSGWIQLWALPLIMLGQSILGRDGEIRDQETHDLVKQGFDLIKQELQLAKEERDIEKEERAMLQQILSEIHELITNITKKEE